MMANQVDQHRRRQRTQRREGSGPPLPSLRTNQRNQRSDLLTSQWQPSNPREPSQNPSAKNQSRELHRRSTLHKLRLRNPRRGHHRVQSLSSRVALLIHSPSVQAPRDQVQEVCNPQEAELDSPQDLVPLLDLESAPPSQRANLLTAVSSSLARRNRSQRLQISSVATYRTRRNHPATTLKKLMMTTLNSQTWTSASLTARGKKRGQILS